MAGVTGYRYDFYYDESGRLICEKKYSENGAAIDKLVYLYDENTIIGVVYTANGATNPYFFERNLLGDVIGIYDTNGVQVAKYKYDAWGNCTITLGTTNIATRNPIRYRGYYYDTETGLYYLNARYYNPEWRRFIQPADASSLNPNSINGLNLYNYANNDPIGVAYSSSNVRITANGEMVSSIGNTYSYTGHNILKSAIRIPLPTVPWLAENATTIYGSASSLFTGIPIFCHYYKYASIINDEFKLYGISKWKTSLQLSNVSFKIGALDGALIGVNVLIDMYDSYQRGVNTEGILLGGALTAASGVGIFYLNKGITWATTTIGTAICPGIGTAIGFTVGLIGSILVDIFLGELISNWIDNNVK